MWQRSPNSYASTIPQQLLLVTRAPTPSDEQEVYVNWSLNEDGEITISFEAEENEDGDDD